MHVGSPVVVTVRSTVIAGNGHLAAPQKRNLRGLPISALKKLLTISLSLMAVQAISGEVSEMGDRSSHAILESLFVK
jgi:hypothetical protein